MAYKKVKKSNISKSSPHWLQCRQRITVKSEKDYFQVSLLKLSVLHGVPGNPRYHRLWLAAPWATTKCWLLFWGGCPSVLASGAGYLFTIPLHIPSSYFVSLALKGVLHHMLRTDDKAPVLCWEHYSHLGPNPPDTCLKFHPSPLSLSQCHKWHFTGRTKQHYSAKQAFILDWLQSRCNNRGLLWRPTHFSHRLAWGLIRFWGVAQEVGKRDSLGSYGRVFHMSILKYIGGIILTKHRTPYAGWEFHKV